MEIKEMIEALPLVLKYVVPGFLYLALYYKLTESELPKFVIWYSLVISFALMEILKSTALCIVVSIFAAIGTFFLVKYSPLKGAIKDAIGYTPSKTIWDDVIDYKTGTKMFVQTNLEDSFGGWYVGIDKENASILLCNYSVTDSEGRIQYIPKKSIVAIPLNKINYITIDYPEGSDVEKFWFGKENAIKEETEQ